MTFIRKRFLFTILSLLFILASLPVSPLCLAEEAAPLPLKTYEQNDITVVFPEMDKELEPLILQALLASREAYMPSGQKIYVLVPQIQKVTQTTANQKQHTRIFAYLSQGVYVKKNSGSYQTHSILTAPYEIYGVKDLNTGSISAYCGVPIPPEKTLWEKLEHDPSAMLKEDITQHAAPEALEEALNFIAHDKLFIEDAWREIIGKPYQAASQTEVSASFQNKLRQAHAAYNQAIEAYNKQPGHSALQPMSPPPNG